MARLRQHQPTGAVCAAFHRTSYHASGSTDNILAVGSARRAAAWTNLSARRGTALTRVAHLRKGGHTARRRLSLKNALADSMT